MNSVKLSGRLTADPELKTTPQGVSVTTFILAVDRCSKNDEADFPTVVAWRQTAEFANRYLKKGRRIIVEGEIRTRTYVDRDGKKHKITEVQADNIEFADSKPQEQTTTLGGFTDIGNDTDFPFN